MKTLYLSMIAIVGGIVTLIVIIWIAPNPTDTSKVFNSTTPDPQSEQKIKAIKLAESSIEVKSLILIFGYHYDSIFYVSGRGLNGTELETINVAYQSNNRSIGPLVVSEDPQLTRIISIAIQQAVYNG